MSAGGESQLYPRDLPVIASEWLDHDGFYRYEDRRRSTEEVHAMARAYLDMRLVLSQIADTSYVGNYDAQTVVNIYRSWARNALVGAPA